MRSARSPERSPAPAWTLKSERLRTARVQLGSQLQDNLVDPVGAEGTPQDDLPTDASLVLIGGAARHGLLGHPVLSRLGQLKMVLEDAPDLRRGARHIHADDRKISDRAMELEELHQFAHGEPAEVRCHRSVGIQLGVE